MRKYKEVDIKNADAEIRALLQDGFTYHEAAKETAKNSPIAFLSLRRISYKIAVEGGYLTPKRLQHSTTSEHGDLLLRSKKKLESQGYQTLSEQNEVRKFVELRGSRGNPDLIGVKGKEVILVEIVERTKTSAILADQLDRFSKIGKVIVVFPLETSGIAFWGLQDLPITSA